MTSQPVYQPHHGLEGLGFECQQQLGSYLFAKYPDWLQHSPSLQFKSVLALAVKWPTHEPDHSPTPNARINEWIYTSIPLCASITCTGTALFYLYLPSVQRCPTRSLPSRPSNHNFLGPLTIIFLKISFLSHSCCITHLFCLLGSHYINISQNVKLQSHYKIFCFLLLLPAP